MVVRFWELEADYRVCDCDWLNSMQIMKESSIFLDRTPTTFKLQWRFNFQLLGPVLRRDAFFRAKRTFCAEVQALCVQLSSKWWERSTDRRKLAAKLPAELRALHGAVGAPSDFHLVSSTLSNWYWEWGGQQTSDLYIIFLSTEGGAVRPPEAAEARLRSKSRWFRKSDWRLCVVTIHGKWNRKEFSMMTCWARLQFYLK